MSTHHPARRLLSGSRPLRTALALGAAVLLCPAAAAASEHVNQPPIAVNDTYTTPMNTSLVVPAPGVLANDSDPNGDPLTAGMPTQPLNGTLTLSTSGAFTYTPNPGFSGTDSFTYMAHDPSGGMATATVTIDVRGAPTSPPPNTAPDCSAVTADPALLEPATRDQFKTITLTGATDADGDTLSYQIDSVTQDEAVLGAGDDTSPDAQLIGGSADTNQLLLRAERHPKGNGRVYRVAYTVSDGTATCDGIATVAVPRKKGQAAEDDGDSASWDSLTGAQVKP